MKQAEAQGSRYGRRSRSQAPQLHLTMNDRSSLKPHAGSSCVTRTRADIPGSTICISVTVKQVTTTYVNYHRVDRALYGALI